MTESGGFIRPDQLAALVMVAALVVAAAGHVLFPGYAAEFHKTVFGTLGEVWADRMKPTTIRIIGVIGIGWGVFLAILILHN